MHKKFKKCLIALGGNLPSPVGAPCETVLEAFRVISEADIQIIDKSNLYNTPCFPAGAGPEYVNAAAVLSTDLAACDLLTVLHSIEARFDRAREQRWGQRTLDLDLLAVENQVLPHSDMFKTWHQLSLEDQKMTTPQELILPHPRLQDRAFVLVPLAEVAPDWVHPVLKLSVKQMLANLPAADVRSVVPLTQC